MELPWEQEAGGGRGFKRMETGIYRTSFTADSAWNGQKVYLEVEGVAMQAKVLVNGKPAGEIDYGYVGGCFDISGLLEYGAQNSIEMSIFTGQSDGSRWYTGGGIIRPVSLIVKNPMSIAQDGLYITTPEVSAASAKVAVQVELEGFKGSHEDVDIIAQIFAPDGSKVAEVSQKAPLRNNLSFIETKLPEITLASPQLWSCESPSLYTAKVQLKAADGKLLDELEESFGVRSISFDKAYGFKLNGEKVFLKGMANHHDLGALGAASYDDAIERMLIRMKEFGFNHVRFSHNPYSKGFLKLCDKHGILVVDELYDKWETEGGRYWIGAKPFKESWFNHERAWIRRDRNHPCVIMWSLSNESQINEEWNGLPDTHDFGVTTYRVMKTFGQRWDDTRPYTAAMFPSRYNSIYKQDDRFDMPEFVRAPEIALISDVAALNYQFRKYEQYLKHDPHLNIYQSEASTSELAAPFFGMQERMIGLAYWGAIEYWGESDGWPKKGWNYSFFNSALEAYPQAYLIKSAFCDEPVVHIGVVDAERQSIDWNDILSGKTPMSENWNRPAGSTQAVYVFSNADEVELFANGKSLGVKKNDRSDIDRRNIFLWEEVAYGKGGKLEAVARNHAGAGARAGLSVGTGLSVGAQAGSSSADLSAGSSAGKATVVARHAIETTGKATALKAILEPSNGELSYIRVYAVDNRGRIVKTARNAVKFEIAEAGGAAAAGAGKTLEAGGAAQLVAIDNQDHYTDELFDVNPKALKDGFVMAIVRKGNTPSTLKISAPGLKGASVVVPGGAVPGGAF